MYGLAAYEPLTQRNGEGVHEGATERLSKKDREKRLTRPHVVRDLSWELARYLDVEDFGPQPADRRNER